MNDRKKKKMEKSENKKRIFEYDLMRVIFMLMVLGIHILTKIKTFSSEFNTTWTIVNIFTNFFMICNPLFFMLSGKFNLNKEFNNKTDYKKYFKNKIISIIIPFLLSSIIIYILLNHNGMNIKDFFKKFIGGTIEGTYWFVYMLLGIILLSPFFSKMIKNMSVLDKKVFFALVLGITTILTTLLAMGIKTAVNFAAFGIISWNFYYILGYFVEDIFKSSKSRKIMIVMGFIAFVIQFLIERFYKSAYRLYDPSPILTLEAIGLYLLILDYIKIKNEIIKKIVSFIAKYSYIFYLFHNTVIYYVFKYIKFDLNISSEMNLVYGIVTFLITFIITIVCSIIFKYIFDISKDSIIKIWAKYYKEKNYK